MKKYFKIGEIAQLYHIGTDSLFDEITLRLAHAAQKLTGV